MKKVGLLTLPLKDNYGGILQAVALYNFLSQKGYEVTLINKQFHKNKMKKVAYFFLERIPFQSIRKIRPTKKNSKLHRLFIDNWVEKKTERVVSERELASIVDKYGFDAVVVGSDQVWRMEYIDKKYYRAYFLSFVKRSDVCKIAYAASFGLADWQDSSKEKEITELLADFDFVSTREDSGTDVCKKLGREDCAHTLDPTLLFNKEFYESLIADCDANKGDFLCYMLDETELSKSITSTVLTTLPLDRTNKIFSHNGMQNLTIPEWLNSFVNAEFIVTDSFHGTIFSIIFNKQFIAISNGKRGSSRFESLLNLLNLEDRLVTDKSENLVKILNQPIDYQKVNSLLSIFRRQSSEFLVNALENKR